MTDPSSAVLVDEEQKTGSDEYKEEVPARKRSNCSSDEPQRLLASPPGTFAPNASTSDRARDFLLDLKDMRNAQSQICEQLNTIKCENHELYDDMAQIREQVYQQQVIVSKLVHFLMTVLGGRRTFLKRTFPYIMGDPDVITKKARQLQYVQTDSKEVHLAQICDKNPVYKAASTSGAGSRDFASLIKANVMSDRPSKVKAEIRELTHELRNDIQSLKDVLITATGFNLPMETIEKLLSAIIAEGQTVDSPVSTSSLAGVELEKRHITQQELIDEAAVADDQKSSSGSDDQSCSTVG